MGTKFWEIFYSDRRVGCGNSLFMVYLACGFVLRFDVREGRKVSRRGVVLENTGIDVTEIGI